MTFIYSDTFTGPAWWFNEWNQVNYKYLLARTQWVLDDSITSYI